MKTGSAPFCRCSSCRLEENFGNEWESADGAARVTRARLLDTEQQAQLQLVRVSNISMLKTKRVHTERSYVVL